MTWSWSDILFAVVLGGFLVTLVGYGLLLLIGAVRTIRNPLDRQGPSSTLNPWEAPTTLQPKKRRWWQ
jgi:hypothetical protein